MRPLIILLFLLLVPPAAAQTRQTAGLRFTTTAPGAPAGVVLDADYLDGPGGRPHRVTRVVTALARGARYDTSVPAQCPASDAELTLRGAAACPVASVVGTGWLEIDTGAGDQMADVTFLNRTDELIFVNTVRGTPARTILRAAISGTSTTSDVPFLPGLPPDGGVLDRVHFEDFQTGSYITTPVTCWMGRWINRVTFTYADGVTETVRSASPCKKPKKRKKKRARR
jgi:hypothetical protein